MSSQEKPEAEPSVKVRRATVVPWVTEEPDTAQAPAGTEPATAPEAPTSEDGLPESGHEPEAGTTAAAAARGGTLGIGINDAEADPPSSRRRRKPLLAVAGILGAVLVAVPFLLMSMNDGPRHADRAREPVGEAALPAEKPDARARTHTVPSSSPSPSPSPSPSSSDLPALSEHKPGKKAAARPTPESRPNGSAADQPAAVNVALGKPVELPPDDSVDGHAGSNITDGSVGTYWQSEGGTEQMHTVKINFGADKTISRVVLKMPPTGTRAERLFVTGGNESSNASVFLSQTADYTFDAANDYTTTIRFSATSVRSVVVWFNASSDDDTTQLAELEAY